MITLFKTNHMMYKRTPEQKRSYFASLETAREQGRAEGRAIGRAEGRAESIAEGIAEGKAEARAEVIRRALEFDMPLSKISEVFGIDEETVRAIAASMEQKK
jgi:predicted transposase YdaD